MGTCLSYAKDLTVGNDSKKTIPDYIERKSLPKYIPQITSGRIVEVYDGDTMTLAARVPGDTTIYQFQLRLRGLDCAEMKTKNNAEKEVALKAKEHVETRVLGKVVYLENVAFDKYGRLLANVLYGDCRADLGGSLLAGRMAVTYDGGTKICPRDWTNYYADGTL